MCGDAPSIYAMRDVTPLECIHRRSNVQTGAYCDFLMNDNNSNNNDGNEYVVVLAL